MNKRFLLAASLVALTCACQPKVAETEQNDDTNQEEQSTPSNSSSYGGCGCGTQKPQATAPAVEEQKATVAVPAAPQVEEKATVSVPAAPQVEEKATVVETTVSIPVDQKETVSTPEVKVENSK